MSNTRKPPQSYSTSNHSTWNWSVMAACPYFQSINSNAKSIRCSPPFASKVETLFETQAIRNEWGHGYCTDVNGYKLCPMYILFEKEANRLLDRQERKE